jgi:hypothetical protein
VEGSIHLKSCFLQTAYCESFKIFATAGSFLELTAKELELKIKLKINIRIGET